VGSLEFYNKDADGQHISSYVRAIAQETYGRQGDLVFGTAGTNSTDATEKMRIDNAGNVGIGTSAPSAKLDVRGETVVSNGTYGTKLTYSAGNQTGIIDTFGNHGLEFRTNNTERLRILPTGGITFNGDTAQANALDDYEEGTWTPVITTSGIAVSSVAHAKYVKIGRKVSAYVYLTSNNTSGSTINTWILDGLPFNSDGYSPVLHYYGPNIDYNGAMYVEASNNETRFNRPHTVGNQGWMFGFEYFTG
jgi:hypothetical protein